MDKFIERKNIAHYIDQLNTQADQIKRKTLQTLLTEEVAKLASRATDKSRLDE